MGSARILSSFRSLCPAKEINQNYTYAKRAIYHGLSLHLVYDHATPDTSHSTVLEQVDRGQVAASLAALVSRHSSPQFWHISRDSRTGRLIRGGTITPNFTMTLADVQGALPDQKWLFEAEKAEVAEVGIVITTYAAFLYHALPTMSHFPLSVLGSAWPSSR